MPKIFLTVRPIWADDREIIQFQECRAWEYRATQTFNPPYLREDTRCACSMRGHQTTGRSQGRFYFFQKNKTQLFRSQFTTKQNCHLVVAIWNLLLCSERNLSDEYAGFLEMKKWMPTMSVVARKNLDDPKEPLSLWEQLEEFPRRKCLP